MQKRVLQATLTTVFLAILLLGIPLGGSWLTVAQDNVYAQAGNILQSVITQTDQRLNQGMPLDEAMLQERVDQTGEFNIYLTVSYHNNLFTGGNDPGNDPLVVSAQGAHSQIVTVSIPRSDVIAQTLSVWVLIIMTGITALALGATISVFQAQRLSAPLTRLTRRAEELGSGLTRKEWEPSKIAEIDTVAIELTRSGALLTQRLEAESALAADASHQLRTPLTALSMRLDEILSTSSEEWVREEARISLEQVDRLTQVVHDLINAPRSSQRRTPGVIDLNSVLTQQAEEWKHAFRAVKRELRIQVPNSAAVWGSVGPFTQVVATLIENSLVHGGGVTSVKVRRNDSSTVIEVADQGEGVDPSLGNRIFERSVSGRKSQGTGVGLALARTLVEDDGGRLELMEERPAKFGVFLATAPSIDSGEKLADDESEYVSNLQSALSHGKVISRQERKAQRAQRNLKNSNNHLGKANS